MASGGGQQQQHHQQHQHKISPRKFSEKIALLNKKQLEGNAEFEEIIKEVQATRSQSACGNNWSSNNGFRMGGGDARSSGCVLYGDVEGVAILSGDDGLVVDEANLTSEQQDELEEVYQDLIKGIKQGDQQQQQPDQPANSIDFNDNNFQQYNPTTRLTSSASRIPNHSNRHHQQPLTSNNSTSPLNQSTCVNIPNNNDLNPFIQTYETTQDTTTTTKRNNILEPYPLYAQEPVAASCRARGTSVGSTNYKHICANALQPRAYQQPSSSSNSNCNNNNLAQDSTGWPVSYGGGGSGGSDGIYLKPSGAYDRSWQKSSSDPALHVPCNLLPNENSIINPNSSCFSDNFSTIGQTMDLEQCQQRQPQGNLIKMVEDNNNNNIGTGAILSINDPEQQENMGPVAALYNYIESPLPTTTNSQQIPIKIQDQGYFTTVNQNQQQQQAAEMIDGGGGSLSHFKQYDESSNSNNENNNIDIRGNLPGIKICAVMDDDCSQQQQLPDHQVPKASSTSDLVVNGGVQFDAFDKSQEFEQIDDQSNDSRQEGGACEDGRNKMVANEWISSDGLDQNGCNDNDNCSQVRLAFDGSGGGGIVFDQNQAIESTNCGGWSNIVSSNNNINNPSAATNDNLTGSLYEPSRVNNLLSNSECGLSHRLLLATDDLSNINMIRSHSHNSIDYLTRHKRAPTSINYSASTHHHHSQQYHLQQQNQYQHQQVSNQPHYPGQQQQQQHYNLVQIGPPQNNRLLSKYDGSANSMRPQHGSLSPLDSSSNLNSPQSERNSPGSSATIDYGEPLVSFQKHQHQLNDINQIETPMSECMGGRDTYLAGRNYRPQDERSERDTFINNLGCEPSPAATITTLAYAPGHQEVQLPVGAGSCPQAGQFQQQQHFQPHQMSQQSSLEPARSIIGPCQSFSLSRRLHNQACRGSYSMQFSSSSTNLSSSIPPATETTSTPLPKESHANIPN